MTITDRLFRPLPAAILALALCGAGALWAQLEHADLRGVAPIDGSGSYEVSGVHVDVESRTADAARSGGWREAQRKGWKMLWARVNGKPIENAPTLPDSTLDSIASGIVVEKEQIGPNRYIASLGVLFDRARAGELLGVKGTMQRSAPMLLIPVEWNGNAPQSFEVRTDWQKAWARFRSGNSPVDYVRVSGTGADPVLLNMAQTRRPGRGWWRMLLDQYGAADIVVPEVTLYRQWPGGPVIGRFVARHGPDGTVITGFTLHSDNADGLAAMLDEGAAKIDAAYTQALQDGALRADKSLVAEAPALPASEANGIDDVLQQMAAAAATNISIQVDTPDVAALRNIEGGIKAMAGVTTVQTESLAIGGVSILRIGFSGPATALREALAARGWRVEDTGGGLRIRRAETAGQKPQ